MVAGVNALDQMGPFHVLLDKIGQMGLDKVGMHIQMKNMLLINLYLLWIHGCA